MPNFDYHSLLGISATLIGFIGYVPYYRDIFRQKITPHPFTYGIWTLLSAITLLAQLAKGAGPGAWVSAVPVLAGIGIVVLTLKQGGSRLITRSDWVLLATAGVAIVAWGLTENPLYAVVISTFAAACAFVPTFRKSYHRPYEETAASYALGASRSLVAIPALLSFNLTTLLPLVYHASANIAFVALLLIRRRQLGNS